MKKSSIDFWRESIKTVYDQANENLIQHGYTEEEADSLLEALYHAAIRDFQGKAGVRINAN